MQLRAFTFLHLPFHWHGKELVKTTLPRRWAVLRELVFDTGQLLMVCTSLEYVCNLPTLFVLCHFSILPRLRKKFNST